jgi:hypothetical protein
LTRACILDCMGMVELQVRASRNKCAPRHARVLRSQISRAALGIDLAICMPLAGQGANLRQHLLAEGGEILRLVMGVFVLLSRA